TVVDRDVLALRASGTVASIAIRFSVGDGVLAGEEEPAGAVQHHPARVNDVDSGVHQDGEVRRGGEARDRNDLRGPQRLSQPADRRDELPRGPFELGSVRQEHTARGLGGDEVRIPRDDGPLAGDGLLRDLEIGKRSRYALRGWQVVRMVGWPRR